VNRVLAIAFLVVSALMLPALAESDPGDQAVRECAARFGAALKAGNPSDLRSILPSRGKVQVRVDRFGPEEGFFSASHVEAIFRDFLKRGSLTSFEIQHVEHDRQGYALVRARAGLVDESGRRETVGLRLAMQPEGDVWVLREIRETRQ